MKIKILLGLLAACAIGASTASAQVTVTTLVNGGLQLPTAVAVDDNGDIYVTDAGNNRIARIDGTTYTVSTFAGTGIQGTNDGASFQASFRVPWGLVRATWGGTNGLVVADSGNHTIRFVSLTDGSVVTLAGAAGVAGLAVDSTGTNARFFAPLGLASDGAGNIYIADSKNNAIRVMSLNDPALGVTNISVSGTTFFGPAAVTVASSTQFWVADTRHAVIKRVDLTTPTSGTVTTVIGSSGQTGGVDNQNGNFVRFNNPSGLLWFGGTAGLLVADTDNNSLRQATNYVLGLATTNFGVATFAGTNGVAGNVDGAALVARFNSPIGMARDLLGGVLIADRVNNSIRRVQLSAPQPAVPTPQIGRLTLISDPNTGSTTLQLSALTGTVTLNNDVTIGISTTEGTETYFTEGPSPASPLEDTIPTPSPSSGSAPPFFLIGQSTLPTSLLDAVTRSPDMTFKARGFATERQPSDVVQVRLVFKTASPVIVGNNAASFIVNDTTTDATLWYTTDGTTPTNAAPSIGPISPGSTISLNAITNIPFSIRAFKDNYYASAVVTNLFLTNNFAANRMTFGFSSGEASSDFIGSAGQWFTAPITLSLLPGQKMYSLQFNVQAALSNGVSAITPGEVQFETLLGKPIPGTSPVIFTNISPAMFTNYTLTYVTSLIDNSVITNVSGGLIDSVFTNSALNLIGLGWFERYPHTNLYDTTAQDLIKYSRAHNILFDSSDQKVVVGAFGFRIPASALPGDTYMIALGRPSASDLNGGIGSVFIDAPRSGSMTNGVINATKLVTVGQRKYLVGDGDPFRWFNAGDFGDNILVNADVMNVFQSAAYFFNTPPVWSDYFDALDSSDSTASYDGDDTTINSIAFGDGLLQIDDVFVTFRRSLDPTLTNWVRYWPNDGGSTRAAEIYTNSVYYGRPTNAAPQARTTLTVGDSTDEPFVTFIPTDVIASGGQTVDVPIVARILGPYPIRTIMFNLNVRPVDGSPEITVPIQFIPSSGLGSPTLSQSQGSGNYSGVWLDTSVAGVWGTNLIGTARVTLPAGAGADSAYRVSLDRISSSPNGLRVIPETAVPGLITGRDRSASSWNDGIPDSWRMRYFGTLNNFLSHAWADADGDGIPNYREYLAGTDPNDKASMLVLRKPQAAAQTITLRWPTVSGKTYLVESATSLDGPWVSASAPIAGTGNEAVFTADTGGQTLFFRVRVQ